MRYYRFLMRHRVWSETLCFADLVADDTVALLQRYRLDALVAVRPWQVDEAVPVFAKLQAAGVFCAVWPMLADEDGRWASASSMAKYVAFAEHVVDVLNPAEVVVDLEPAFDRLRNWKALRAAPKADPTEVKAYERSRSDLASAIARWRARSVGQQLRVTTAVIPVVAFDPSWAWAGVMQRLLGTPVDGLDVDRHSVMAYTSLLEGWSRGVVNRSRAEWLLARFATRTARKWGSRGAVSLGTVAPGAFGDEPSYRSPEELARDVKIARAAGVSELSLFDLGGVMRSADPQAWLQALTT